MKTRSLAAGVVALAILAPTEARAEEAAAQPGASAEVSVAPVTAPEGAIPPSNEIEEAPPPLPRKKGIVLDSSLGVLGFLGSFRRVAPSAPWFHTQLGYELFSWLMFFGEGDLAFTDTSNAQDPSKTRAFPIFGFGGGTRITVHSSERTAFYLESSLGLMKADVSNNAFAILGYRGAERLGFYIGGRLGFEWYQVNRHLAIGLGFGIKDATGFAHTIGGSDTPLLWDAGLSLRYTF